MRRGCPVNAARFATDILSMKLGFISINVPGHLNPMTALARQLQARNHDVVFLYSSGAAGLPFVPRPEGDQPESTHSYLMLFNIMRNWGRSGWACLTYTYQTRCTLITPATLPWPFMIGLMRLHLELWPETGRESKGLLKCWSDTTRTSERMRKRPN